MAKKYEIVACVGDPWDYSYDLVDETNKWKDARNAFFEGADVYCNKERVYFIDPKLVADAFKTLATFYRYMMSWSFPWDDGLEFEDEVAIKDAQDVLEKNGFKLNANGWPDGDWEDKITERRRVNNDSISVPFYRRSFAIPVYSADTHELVRVENGKCETDELPF